MPTLQSQTFFYSPVPIRKDKRQGWAVYPIPSSMSAKTSNLKAERAYVAPHLRNRPPLCVIYLPEGDNLLPPINYRKKI